MIRGSLRTLFFFVAFTLVTVTGGLAGPAETEHPTKLGILMVAFGSSMPEAQISFENIDQKVKAAFPEIEIRWAFSSHIIRNKMNKQGAGLLSPQQALISMADDGFNRVAVQSLHSIPGEEFSALAATVRAFSDMPDGIEKISIGNPLLFTTQDLLTVSDALIANFPKERKKNEMILFMGHGTPHPANVYYPALAQVLCRKDPNIRIATVEGWPELADILPDLSAQESKTIYLMPFMSVAGDHARNDMAGDEPDSWKSILESQGLTVIPVLHGTAEFDEIVDIWIAHLQDALKTIM